MFLSVFVFVFYTNEDKKKDDRFLRHINSLGCFYLKSFCGTETRLVSLNMFILELLNAHKIHLK